MGIFVYQGDNIQVYENQIYRIAGLGIHPTQYSAGGSYSNNTIYDVTQPDGNFWGYSSSGSYGAQFRSCIYISGRNHVVRNNTTANCDYPIYINTATASGNTIENNGSTPPAPPASGSTVENNGSTPAPAPPSATLTALQPSAGTVTATWSNITNATPTDWIGLYRVGAPDLPTTNLLAWIYVSCSKTAASARASGSCPFALPANLVAGTYELRLFANDDYIVKRATATFTVSAPSIASPTLTASQSSGGTVTATWSNISNPTPTDWIGLYRAGAPDLPTTNLLAWIYVSCSKTAASARASGSCPFALPPNLAAGTYELRLFANDDYIVKLATATFTVSAPSVSSPTAPGNLTVRVGP